MSDILPVRWRKSSHSGSEGGECVEVAAINCGKIGVRDSKNPAGGHIAIGRHALRSLLAEVKTGRHDL